MFGRSTEKIVNSSGRDTQGESQRTIRVPLFLQCLIGAVVGGGVGIVLPYLLWSMDDSINGARPDDGGRGLAMVAGSLLWCGTPLFALIGGLWPKYISPLFRKNTGPTVADPETIPETDAPS